MCPTDPVLFCSGMTWDRKAWTSVCPRTCGTCSGPLYCANSTFLCRNGGTCRNITSSGLTSNSYFGFRCECGAKHTGALCETKSMNIVNTCKNGGSCFALNNTLCLCKCPYGFEGSSCEKADCCVFGPPCQNNGTCYNLKGVCSCLCAVEWSGQYCESASIITRPPPGLVSEDTNNATNSSAEIVKHFNLIDSNFMPSKILFSI
jgi:hypothetical protein